MATTPTWWPNLEGKAEPEVTRAMRILYDKTQDHDGAFAAVKTQLTAIQKKQGTGISTPGATTQIAPTPAATYTPAAGVNVQTGTAYVLQATDLAGLIVVASAAAIAVTLNGTLGAGFYSAVQNLGPGTATLTPSIGKVNNASSLALSFGTGAGIYFDGVNWWALTSEEPPVISVFGRTGVVTAQSGDYTAAQVTGAEQIANKGQPNGYAPLNASSQVPAANLPSGASGTITLAKLTAGGANGSLTVSNGIVTAFTNPS